MGILSSFKKHPKVADVDDLQARGDMGPDIAEMLTPAVVELLVAGLGKPDKRDAAREVLRESNSIPRVVTALIAALKDDDYEVRTCVTALLATSLDPRVEEPLIATLKDEVEGVRLIAAMAVGAIAATTPGGDPRALAALKNAVDAEKNPTLKNMFKIVITAVQESPVTAAQVRAYTAAGLRAGPGQDPLARDAFVRISEAVSAP
jgi:HEAT repeats